MTDTRTETIPQSEIREREAEWNAEGWQIVRLVTFRSSGVRRVQVDLVRKGT